MVLVVVPCQDKIVILRMEVIVVGSHAIPRLAVVGQGLANSILSNWDEFTSAQVQKNDF